MREKQNRFPINKNPLDKAPKKRGPHFRILPSEYAEILERAEHYQAIFWKPVPAKRKEGVSVPPDPEADRAIAERYRENPELGKTLWERLREPLLNARKPEDVTKALAEYCGPYLHEFVPKFGYRIWPTSESLSRLILKVVHERKFWFLKGPQAQSRFLPDSIAALGRVSPKRSRDICQQERKKQAREKSNAQPMPEWALYLAGSRTPT